MKRIILNIAFSLTLTPFLFAQNKDLKHILNLNYSTNFGNKELSTKSNFINCFGLEYNYYPKKFYVGAQYQLLFGQYTGVDLFKNIRTSEGLIIADDGSLIDLKTQFTGNQAHLLFGFPLFTNTHWHTETTLGAGFMQNQLKSKTLEGTSAYLSKSNLKGYDQWSIGPSTIQEARLIYLSENRKINFKISTYIQEVLLWNIRKYNYYNNTSDTNSHFNFIFGIQIGWIIPIYSSVSEDIFE